MDAHLARIAELEAQVAEQTHTIIELRKELELCKRSELERRGMIAAIECCTDFIGIASLDGKVLYINEAGRRLVGIEPTADISHTAMVDYVMPSDYQVRETVILPALKRAGQWAGRLRFRHIHTGTEIPVHYSAYVVRHPETGAPMALATVTRDLRQEQQAANERLQMLEQQSATSAALRDEQARAGRLEEEHQQMIAAIENSGDFIGICDLEGRGLYLNPAGRKIIGFDLDADVRSLIIANALTPEANDLFMREVIPALLSLGEWEGELHLKHLETGEVVPVWYKPFLIHDPRTKQPRGVGAVARDQRAIKRAEDDRRRMHEEIILAQADALAELSTPLIPISEKVVVMPLIGNVDAARAGRVIESLLAGVSERSARVAILDITGVSTVDATVAEALISAARAVRLLGAEVVLTGIRSDVARALIDLGADLSNIVTRSTLQSGIAFAMRTG